MIEGTHCPQCDALNPPGQKFCGECGHPLQAGMTRPLSSAEMTRYSGTITYAQEPVVEYEKRGPGPIIAVSVPLILLLLIGVLALLFFRPGGSSTPPAVSAAATRTAVQPSTTPLVAAATDSPPPPADTPAPTDMLPPLPTETPLPTVDTNTPAGAVLEVGQSWKQGGMELTLAYVVLSPTQLTLTVMVTSLKSQDISIRYSPADTISVRDNLGRPWKARFYDCTGYSDDLSTISVVLAPNETVPIIPQRANCSARDSVYVFGDTTDPAVTEIQVTFTGISSIKDARWRISIEH